MFEKIEIKWKRKESRNWIFFFPSTLFSQKIDTSCPPQPNFSKTLLKENYEEKKKKVDEEISKAGTVSLTADCWTSDNHDAYIAISAHFITPEWELKEVLFVLLFLLWQGKRLHDRFAHTIAESLIVGLFLGRYNFSHGLYRGTRVSGEAADA